MTLLAIFILAFSFIRLGVSLWNFISRPVLPPGSTNHSQQVSLLIPARNEEENIARLLEDLTKSHHKNLEIILYDDDSLDNTREVVMNYSEKDPRIKLMVGKDLPSGWTGKNHACYQLASRASGNYLLFVDADVTTKPELIGDLLALQKKYELSLLSVFPEQLMKSTGEKITVPFMNRTLLSLLPLMLIRKSSNPSLSAANGQCMLFTKESYDTNQWHKQFASNPVEDITIMRNLKKAGEKGYTVLSRGQIRCRMYKNMKEAVVGFSKNIHAYFGNSYLIMSVYLLITTFGFILVWIPFGIAGLVALMLAESAIVLLTSILSRQKPIINLLAAPIQQITALYTGAYSIMNKIRGYGVWKGRKI